MLKRTTLAVTALLAAAPAYAQDKTAEVDKIFSWVKTGAPGCAVAVSYQGKVVINRAYGLADLERDVPITTSSVFDAGSVVKQFVAASVLMLVADGKISLSDDVRKYIPELADYGHAVTINHLLTHTSGIRDWTGMRAMTEGDPDMLALILRQRSLDFVPGEELSYSNSGFVLLKEIVARTSGKSFTDFTTKRLFEPLGMKSSKYVTDMTEIVKNRALAYEREGPTWKQSMYLGNDRGGGGLLTTPSDLLIWNDALSNDRLGAFVSQKMLEPTVLNNGRKINYGRALFLDSNRGGKVIWHSGGAAGYGTFLVRFPEQQLSVASMCNAGDDADGGTYARRIFDLFVPASIGADATAAPGATPDAPKVAAPADLGTRAGLYFNERTGQPMRLVVNNGTLSVAGGMPFVPVAPDRFRNQRTSLQFMSGAELELQFLTSDRFQMKSKEGDITLFRRAQPYAPTVAELKAFAGRYESDELGSTLEMVPDKGGLIMRFARNPSKAVPLTPVDRDTFMISQMYVRFVRDKSGKVIGYDYGNPALRKLRMTRVGS